MVLVNAMACGTRTELFDGLVEENDEPATDAGEFTDAPPTSFDASARSDAGRYHDASTPLRDASVIDAGVRESIDAAPPRCNALTPTALATATYELDQVAVDDRYVYFHDHDGISRVSKTGGDQVLLANMTAYWWPDLQSFFIDDAGVTWMQILGGQQKTAVDRISKSSGSISTLTTLGDDFYFGSSAGSGSIYAWTGTNTSYALDEIAANGTTSIVSSLFPSADTSHVLHDAQSIFFAGEGGVYRLDGTTPTLLGYAEQYVTEMVLDDTNIYFLSTSTGSEATLSSVPKTGGTVSTLWTQTGSWLGGIAIDDTHLYVVDRSTPDIVRMNKDGTNAIAFVTDTPANQIIGVAVDEECIYWTMLSASSLTSNHVFAQQK